MTHTKNRWAMAALALGLLIVGLVAGYGLARRGSGDDMAMADTPAAGDSGERKALYWYDPMVPDQHFEQPGKSPFMDMQLVPKFDSGADSNCTVRDVEAAATAEPRP